MTDRGVTTAPVGGAPHVTHARSALCIGPHPNGTTLSTGRDHLALAASNGTDHKMPIASAARGSVQSGFNDVALATLAIVGVARPHRSFQILSRFSRPGRVSISRSFTPILW